MTFSSVRVIRLAAIGAAFIASTGVTSAHAATLAPICIENPSFCDISAFRPGAAATAPVTPAVGPSDISDARPSTQVGGGSGGTSFVWMWHHEVTGWEMRNVQSASVAKRLAEGDLIAYDNDAPDGTLNTHLSLRSARQRSLTA
jgi:hypothetical protein